MFWGGLVKDKRIEHELLCSVFLVLRYFHIKNLLLPFILYVQSIDRYSHAFQLICRHFLCDFTSFLWFGVKAPNTSFNDSRMSYRLKNQIGMYLGESQLNTPHQEFFSFSHNGITS